MLELSDKKSVQNAVGDGWTAIMHVIRSLMLALGQNRACGCKQWHAVLILL